MVFACCRTPVNLCMSLWDQFNGPNPRDEHPGSYALTRNMGVFERLVSKAGSRGSRSAGWQSREEDSRTHGPLGINVSAVTASSARV